MGLTQGHNKFYIMQYKMIIFFSLLFCITLNAQNIKNTEPVKYDVIVSFGSMCCGTASGDFLKEYVKNYNCKNKDTVNGWLLNGCGREGEYKILFSLAALTDSQKKELKGELKTLIDEQNKKNKTVNASSGSISLGYDLPITNFEYCRGELTEWYKKIK